jgi:hypothetical protein
MFRTVRHWWSEGSGQHAARLFVFEFVVVAAGVLVAQGLANWVHQQADNREGRSLLAVAQLFVRSSNERANYWIRHANCVRGHVDDISRAAEAGRTLSSDAIGYATMPGVRSPDFTQDQLDKLAHVIGAKRTRALKHFEVIDAFVTDDSSVVSNEWTNLRLLDPSVGMPSAEDRAQVRLAAIVLDPRFAYLFGHAELVRQAIAATGMPLTDGEPTYLHVDRCGLNVPRTAPISFGRPATMPR